MVTIMNRTFWQLIPYVAPIWCFFLFVFLKEAIEASFNSHFINIIHIHPYQENNFVW